MISSKLELDSDGNTLNPIDAHFKSLNLESMEPVDMNSYEFGALSSYAKNTHGATHSHYKVNVEAAFRVTRFV